jgi:glyoxylase-like metal-dependent hydrolase (beta-lactamase superfamily II)
MSDLVEDWCAKPLRLGLEKLKEIKTSRSWFKVYDVGQNTYAIEEPYNWEETISYLILGKDKALLFDTGMGLDTISLVVKELTKLPILVLNSHTHPDHIGGNNEFNNILAMDTRYTRTNAANGYAHNDVKWEVSPASFCVARLPHKDTAHYYIKPFKVSRFITSDYMIDLGGRKIKVIATPGHTPDAICLYDNQAGYLWCGDSFYEGPILLSSDGTDLKAYQKSINKMAQLAARLNCVLPAHNLPIAKPALLIEAAQRFNEIASGNKKGKPGEDHILTFNYDKFSFQIDERFMQQLAQ